MSKKQKTKETKVNVVVGYAVFNGCDGFGNDSYLLTNQLFKKPSDAQYYYNKIVDSKRRHTLPIIRNDNFYSVSDGACIVEMTMEK